MTIFRKIILAAGFAGIAGTAQAGLSICNETEFVQSVALGYEGESDWTSKGWWNIEPNDCAVVVGGDLGKRFYYIRAEVNGGEFSGEGYMFCTTPEEFEIAGDTNCEGRGYATESFREIDTGETATDFTYTLVGDGSTAPPPDNGPGNDSTADLGLSICNATADVQSVSIGYENAEGFISEGWWNIEPDDCAKVLGGKLEQRYYYYRAEVNAGSFEGEGYMFCTSPEVYSIQGDSDCEARGYDTESFSEIDTGAAAQGFTFTISADGNAAPPPRNDPPPVQASNDDGIRVCNETAFSQSIAFGYEGPEDWTSTGWWNLDPGECTEPAMDGVNRRYLFYRADSSGGEFVGENYFFCVTSEPFEIVGDSNCGARGYERAAFREIDTGSTTDTYTLTLLEEVLYSQPDTAPGDDSTVTDGGPVEDDTPQTPVFDFDLPGDVSDTPDSPESPDTDMTATDPDFGPADDTPVDDTPVVDAPQDDPFGGTTVEEPPADDPAGDTSTVVEETPEELPEITDPPAADEVEEDDDDRRTPTRRGGSRGG